MSGHGLNAEALGVIIIFLLLVIYIVGGSFMDHYHFKLGHETTIALILGLLVSVTVFIWTDQT